MGYRVVWRGALLGILLSVLFIALFGSNSLHLENRGRSKEGFITGAPIMETAKENTFISEIELNPLSTNEDEQWIELIVPVGNALKGYSLLNAHMQPYVLGELSEGINVVTLKGMFLDVREERLLLLHNGIVIDESETIRDLLGAEQTWSYCGKWKFDQPSKGAVNLC